MVINEISFHPENLHILFELCHHLFDLLCPASFLGVKLALQLSFHLVVIRVFQCLHLTIRLAPGVVKL